MHVDFASEYARRSDEELRLLIQDRHNLVDVARDALDAEVHKRKITGFQVQAYEPVEPRLEVEQDESGNEIVVHSRDLKFPKICPRCLEAADSAIRVVCNDTSSWLLPVGFDYLFRLLRYLFSSYSVPFCRACAISVRVRRWVQRLFWAGVLACSAYVGMRYELSAWRFLLVCLCSCLPGIAMWKMFEFSKRWPAEGVTIAGGCSADDRRLEFANSGYEKAFVAQNGSSERP